MELESYFSIRGDDDICIRGTRVGIETVLDDYLNGAAPEEIAARYRSLTLEQVYATITYYLRHCEAVEDYQARWRAHTSAAREEQQRNPSTGVRRLRELKYARKDAVVSVAS